VLLSIAAPSAALDLFTLWRAPVIPLQIQPGDRVDYHRTTLSGGQREEELLRVQCVGEVGEAGSRSWLLELLPLAETSEGLEPVAGEGVQLQISERLRERKGDLADLVERVVRWEEGRSTVLAPADWREDPLVLATLQSEFVPQTCERADSSVRVVAGHELRCEQYVLSAADTQRVQLPRATLEQITEWQISAAVNGEVPFLGLAYAAERTRSVSQLDPPSARFAPPPPGLRVETMELVGFGKDARARLGEPRSGPSGGGSREPSSGR
jgi:hypothetical protein